MGGVGCGVGGNQIPVIQNLFILLQMDGAKRMTEVKQTHTVLNVMR